MACTRSLAAVGGSRCKSLVQLAICMQRVGVHVCVDIDQRMFEKVGAYGPLKQWDPAVSWNQLYSWKWGLRIQGRGGNKKEGDKIMDPSSNLSRSGRLAHVYVLRADWRRNLARCSEIYHRKPASRASNSQSISHCVCACWMLMDCRLLTSICYPDSLINFLRAN